MDPIEKPLSIISEEAGGFKPEKPQAGLKDIYGE
jgi:hypothetical protein